MQPITYRIVMFGGQRAGKSSMLASMFMTMEPRAQDAGLRLRSLGGAVSSLHQSYVDLIQMPARLQSLGAADTADIGTKPTVPGEQITYEFALGSPKFDIASLQFVDFAGEDLITHESDVVAQIDSADSVLVAINTPPMMEAVEDPRWAPLHRLHNLPDHFAAAVDRWRGSGYTPDLVVLAPIKCERWISEASEVERLHEAVMRSYGSALSLLGRSPFKENTAICVCPVQTVGSVHYVGIERQVPTQPLSPGNVRMLFEATDGGVYSPVNHEQPFLHALYSLVQGIDYEALTKVRGTSIPQRASARLGKWWEGFKQENLPKFLHEDADIPEIKDLIEKKSGLGHFRAGAKSLADARSTESPVRVLQAGTLYSSWSS